MTIGKLACALLFSAWLCPAIAQPGTDIFLMDFAADGTSATLSNARNITHRGGYDNQPYFHPGQNLLYYSAADSAGRTDIKVFDLRNGTTARFTRTHEREYSPTVTPDGQGISCIIQRDNGAQDLGVYPIKGGEARVVINNLTVGYHAWRGDSELLLFVLGEPATLRTFAVKTGDTKTLASNIGRSLHRIPHTTDVSFVAKENETWIIKRLKADGTIEEITNTLPGREDLAWLPDGRLLMSDGASLFICNPQTPAAAWMPLQWPAGFSATGITRLAVNNEGTLLAVVAADQ